MFGALALVFIAIIKLIFTKMIFPSASINEEISVDRNIGVGIFEAILVVTCSLFTTLIFI
jgi:hypothetical protein